MQVSIGVLKRFGPALGLVMAWLSVTPSFGAATAQATAMETCVGIDACDDVATDFIGKSALLLENDLYVEAAQHLYPVMLNEPRVSPLVQTATRNQFSTILEAAGLFELAAEQKDIANSTTSAPSSVGLLERARLLSKAEEMTDETLAAYSEASALAVQAANLFVIDAIISDYQDLGQRALAQRLRAQRVEAESRATATCDMARCTSRPLIDAAPVALVAPVYPSRALNSGTQGDCTVRVNITEAGQPVDIAAECTDPEFVESASNAAAQTVFYPRFRNGRPEPRHNVVLPFTFKTN